MHDAIISFGKAEKCFDVVSPNKCLINGQFWKNVIGLLITWSACWVKTWPMNQRTKKRGDSRSGSGPHMKCSNAVISLISDGGRFFLRKGKIYSMHAVSYWCIINHVGLHFFFDSGEMWLKFVLFFGSQHFQRSA